MRPGRWAQAADCKTQVASQEAPGPLSFGSHVSVNWLERVMYLTSVA